MIEDVQELVWDHYHSSKRDLPWRQQPLSSYHIFISEMMLQQTQLSRVITKYQEFLQTFPTITLLAHAEFADVLRAWSGLGYNRRAKYLHDASKILEEKPDPWTTDVLRACKGIGPNTAAAICVYSYNQPLVFIETNIRTVVIHHFFKDSNDVTDAEIMPFISKLLDREHPCEWYWAVMDYGSHIKKTIGNASRNSKHYSKQSAFIGSGREIRGKILRLLAQTPMTQTELTERIEDERLSVILDTLVAEALIIKQDKSYRI